MNIIKPSYQIVLPEVGKELETIERFGRICYKSEDKIGEGTAEKFVGGLIKHKHEAMLEHARLIFSVGDLEIGFFRKAIREMEGEGLNNYLEITQTPSENIISGNIRAFRNLFRVCERLVPRTLYNKIISMYPVLFKDIDLRLQSIPEGDYCYQLDVDDLKNKDHVVIMAHGYFTVIFTCDRGISHEIVRHRPASFAQSSTRYCNYTLDKFGNEITVIEPFFFKGTDKYDIWKASVKACEDAYMKLIGMGATPQEARSVLPNSTATELVMTCNYSEWHHFFELRAARMTGPAHPQMEEVAVPLLRDVANIVPQFKDLAELTENIDYEIHGK